MKHSPFCQRLIITSLLMAMVFCIEAQTQVKLKFSNSSVYAGIEVGSKGVKMSILEIGKDAKKTGDFAVIKDTSINTDFITFASPNFVATLNAFTGFYMLATKEYKIAARRVFTVVSSGVKLQAEKENKTAWVTSLVDYFRL